MKYTTSHEWVRLKDSVATVGISQFAQRELGDIVFIELPQLGRSVKKGDQIAVLESTKAAADVYTPVSGKIVAVNEDLKEAPELINQDPEVSGWIFQIELSQPSETDNLLTTQAYQQLVGSP